MPKIISLSQVNDAMLDECAAILDRGGIIAAPTETVYGLVARADCEEAIRKLYTIKGRPTGKPFALFVLGWSDVSPRWAPPNPRAQALAERLWPGPLTLVVEALPGCPAAYDGAVGARAPDHDFVRALLSRCGGLLVNTSLNRSGESPALELDEAQVVLEGVDLAIDAGRLPVHPPSTVVDCQGAMPRFLREGEIASDIIESIWRESIRDS